MSETPPAKEAPPEFLVASPTVAPGVVERTYVGTVRATQHVEVRARVKGFIESVGTDEGRPVRKGHVLFTMDARALLGEQQAAQAAVQSATADMEALRLEHRNTLELVEKGIASEAEAALLGARVAALRARVEEARVAAELAALQVSYAQVRAPFDGVVNRLERKAGSLVDEDELLTTLTNADEVFVYFHVSEQEYLELAGAGPKELGPVIFRTATGEVFPAAGAIDAIASEVDPATARIEFRARFRNSGRLLKHGSVGSVGLRIPTRSAVLVPQRSTFEVQEHVYVYVVDEQGVARTRRIETAARLDDAFVVDKGLQPTDRFIVEGLQRVREGDRVTVRPAANTAEGETGDTKVVP
jgi:membrane fusion protein (multidrug efflux system)